MNDLEYLNRSLQYYKQVGTFNRINVLINANDEEDIDAVVFVDWYGQINIGKREYFNRFLGMNDTEYRVDESCLLYEFKDKETLKKACDIVLEEKKYDIALSKLIDILNDSMKLELK